jgi:SAM-dependent methyltransferase
MSATDVRAAPAAESAYGLQKRIDFCAEVIAAHRPRFVLDVGCGTGTNLTRPLAERFPEVRFAGVDSDAATIRYARETHVLPNLEFRVEGDPGASAGKADLVIASEVVEHVEDPDAFLAALRGQLAAGGRMIVTMPNGLGPFEAVSMVEVLLRLSGAFDLLRSVKRTIARQNPAAAGRDTLAISPHLNFFSHRQATDLFARAGLSVEAYRARTFLCGFGFDHLVRAPGIVAWNARIADRLPRSWVSAWMFVVSPAAPQARPAYSRGPYARWRRRLNERLWGGAPATDALR